jgi:hypothetical protein
MALVFNCSAYSQLDCDDFGDGRLGLVRRRISLVPRAAHRCLPNGGLALWHLVVVDQRQGEAKSDSQWQTSGEVQTSLGEYILVLSLVNGEAALLRRQPTDTDALQ